MIPVLDAARMRAVDTATIEREPISSVDLMERAGARLADRIIHHHRQGRWGDPASVRYRILAGMGNNGGDGLVIARLLHGSGIPVVVDRVLHRTEPSQDHAFMQQRAHGAGVALRTIDSAFDWRVESDEVLVDALFGTGLDRPLEGLAADVVMAMNASNAPIIAIDLPSGLFAWDNRGNDLSRIVRAAITLCIEAPKLPCFLLDHASHVGEWELVPIGLDPLALQEHADKAWLLEAADITTLLPPRNRFDHKGRFGHALLLAGARGMYGAAVLATRAALRSGCGLVTTHVPHEALPILQTAAPEAMVQPDVAADGITGVEVGREITALGMGPGMGTGEAAAALLKRLIQDPPAPLVLDADALNMLAENRTWLSFLPQGTILTPHPGEFDRLHGEPAPSGKDRLERAREMAHRTGAVLVLKGAYTAICAPDGRLYFNATGNPGMAKGGSGDVLTGLLTGLRGQGLAPLNAAMVAVWVHGLAGDMVALHKGMDGMNAGDLIETLPEAFRESRGPSA